MAFHEIAELRQMGRLTNLRAVMFDFIGTTIIESDNSILNRCFVEAFKENGVYTDIGIIKKHRGKEKREMIEQILMHYHQSHLAAIAILDSFRTHLHNNLDNFQLNDGANEVLDYLKSRGIMVGMGTGLPRDIFETILAHVGWNKDRFDYIGIADELGVGRPDPAMLIDMMTKFRLHEDELLKIGDTVADIQEGKNAGVTTAVIISGTQGEEELLKHRPDYVIRSLVELSRIIEQAV